MEYQIHALSTGDRKTVMDIFNHYVTDSFAAFPEQELPYERFDLFLQLSAGFPAGVITNRDGETLGFGMLRSHNPMPAFSQTAEVTYFLHPDHTGKGLGKQLLAFLEKGASEKGITTLLACISSLNPGSIRFHQKNGFTECGRFQRVGRKKGRAFDTVWMQKRFL